MLLNIAERRKELGLTLDELGRMVGVSKSTVKKWESGYIKNMRRDKIVLLAKALQVSPMDILLSAEYTPPHIVEYISPTENTLNNFKNFAQTVFSKAIPKNFGILFREDKLYLIDASGTNMDK